MKQIAAFLIALTATFSLFALARADEETDPQLTKQIEQILKECRKVEVGSTRADLMKFFTTEGGLSNAKQRTFVHKRCPYIKVDVQFTLSAEKQDLLDERLADKISKISKPYLDFNILDWGDGLRRCKTRSAQPIMARGGKREIARSMGGAMT